MHLFEHVQLFSFNICFGEKAVARVIFILLHGKGGQRKHVDTISIFKCVEVVVAKRNANHIGNQCQVSGSGSHPNNIVVSPLDVNRMVIYQTIHYFIGIRPAIKNVTNNMQAVNQQALDKFTDGNDERFCPVDIDNGMENSLEILFFFFTAFIQ